MVMDSKASKPVRQQATLAVRWPVGAKIQAQPFHFQLPGCLKVSMTASVDHYRQKTMELPLSRAGHGSHPPSCPCWHGGAHGRMGREAGAYQEGEEHENVLFVSREGNATALFHRHTSTQLSWRQFLST